VQTLGDLWGRPAAAGECDAPGPVDAETQQDVAPLTWEVVAASFRGMQEALSVSSRLHHVQLIRHQQPEVLILREKACGVFGSITLEATWCVTPFYPHTFHPSNCLPASLPMQPSTRLSVCRCACVRSTTMYLSVCQSTKPSTPTYWTVCRSACPALPACLTFCPLSVRPSVCVPVRLTVWSLAGPVMAARPRRCLSVYLSLCLSV
jgi:hypothetical protein